MWECEQASRLLTASCAASQATVQHRLGALTSSPALGCLLASAQVSQLLHGGLLLSCSRAALLLSLCQPVLQRLHLLHTGQHVRTCAARKAMQAFAYLAGFVHAVETRSQHACVHASI